MDQTGLVLSEENPLFTARRGGRKKKENFKKRTQPLSQAAAKALIVLCAEQVQLGWAAGEKHQHRKSSVGEGLRKGRGDFYCIYRVWRQAGPGGCGMFARIPRPAIPGRGNSLRGGAAARGVAPINTNPASPGFCQGGPPSSWGGENYLKMFLPGSVEE